MLEPPFHQKLTMISAIVFPFIGLIIAVATAWQFGWMGLRNTLGNTTT